MPTRPCSSSDARVYARPSRRLGYRGGSAALDLSTSLRSLARLPTRTTQFKEVLVDSTTTDQVCAICVLMPYRIMEAHVITLWSTYADVKFAANVASRTATSKASTPSQRSLACSRAASAWVYSRQISERLLVPSASVTATFDALERGGWRGAS
jgi:hypothetical protein